MIHKLKNIKRRYLVMNMKLKSFVNKTNGFKMKKNLFKREILNFHHLLKKLKEISKKKKSPCKRDMKILKNIIDHT